MAAPLAQLTNDIPLRPRLTGNLVPQAINLWMGTALHGAQTICNP